MDVKFVQAFRLLASRTYFFGFFHFKTVSIQRRFSARRIRIA
jgi:hypothetical protein